MKIEILFPELCNLFGDISNMRYLRQCLPEAEFVETALDDMPAFLNEDVSLIYMGPATERSQERIISKCRPFRSKIKELLDKGTVFLFTGNAMEMMGEYIENDDGTKIECLGILPFYARRDMKKRHNSTFLGKFENEYVQGFKTQFTMAYAQREDKGLFRVVKGIGLNKKAKYEGIRENNFFGTYLIGPILVLNPPFLKTLLSLMGAEKAEPAFYEEVKMAYEVRLKDFLTKT